MQRCLKQKALLHTPRYAVQLFIIVTLLIPPAGTNHLDARHGAHEETNYSMVGIIPLKSTRVLSTVWEWH